MSKFDRSIALTAILTCLSAATVADDRNQEDIYIEFFDLERVPPSPGVLPVLNECFIDQSTVACESLIRLAEDGNEAARLFVYWHSHVRDVIDALGGFSAFRAVIENHDARTAFEELVILADEGYGPAQAFVGVTFMSGYEARYRINADPARGIAYLQRATDQNSMLAPLHLGHAFDQGLGVDLSHEEATRMFELALARGQGRAGILLAQRAIDGEVVAQDIDYAVEQLVRAAELDYGPAMQVLCEGEAFAVDIPIHPLLDEDEAAYWCEQLQAHRELVESENLNEAP